MSNDRTASVAQSSIEAAESFSRPSSTMLGKNSFALKTSVPDEIGERFTQYARLRGYGSTSECLRDLVMVSVLGVDGMAHLHRERLESLGLNRDKSEATL